MRACEGLAGHIQALPRALWLPRVLQSPINHHADSRAPPDPVKRLSKANYFRNIKLSMSLGYLRGKPQRACVKDTPSKHPKSQRIQQTDLNHTRSLLNQVSTQLRTHNFTPPSISCCLFASCLSKGGRDSLLSFVGMGLAKKHAKHPNLQFYPCVKCEANLTVVCEPGTVESCLQGPGAIPISTRNSLTQKSL